jgi:hypothetical protein
LALLWGDAVGELDLAPTTLDTVKPDLVQLTAAGDFVASDDVHLVTNSSGKRRHPQVIAVWSVWTIVVVVQDGLGGAAVPWNDLDQEVVVDVLEFLVSVRPSTDDESPACSRERGPARRPPLVRVSPPAGCNRIRANQHCAGNGERPPTRSRRRECASKYVHHSLSHWILVSLGSSRVKPWLGRGLHPIRSYARSCVPVSPYWFLRSNVGTILGEGNDGDNARASPRTASPGRWKPGRPDPRGNRP